MAAEGQPPSHEDRDTEAEEVQARLALPLLIPAIVFLFAVLVIYGLSRIYLELDTFEVGDVSMATPLAIGVALVILLASSWMAAARRLTIFQIASVGLVAVALLTAGSIWAAVHEEDVEHVVAPDETPAEDGTPAPGDGVQVGLVDPEWAVTANPESAPADGVTFNVQNEGTITHNLRVIQTDLAPDSLPLDDTGFQVDESQVNVVAQSTNLPAGESEEVTEELEAGSYVLICNIAQHYENGMRVGFTVE